MLFAILKPGALIIFSLNDISKYGALEKKLKTTVVRPLYGWIMFELTQSTVTENKSAKW